MMMDMIERLWANEAVRIVVLAIAIYAALC